MKLLYINDELGTSDGSNSHALGMCHAFEKIIGRENVRTYPVPQDGSQKPVNVGVNRWKSRLKCILAVIRYVRKKYLSLKKSKYIINKLKRENFIPTHVLARSTDFDITAIYIAKVFGAKLIYEVNTPMFYERGVLKKEPMTRQLEKWEKKILFAADKVYVVSNICRDMLCEHYGFNHRKFLVIPNGYMGDLYFEDKNTIEKLRTNVREKEDFEGKFIVTFVGSLKIWHGIKNFCTAVELLEKHENILFLVLGDGELHDYIVNYTRSHSNMIFKGKVSLQEMKEYLYASDLGVMPYEKNNYFYYSPLKMYDMIGAALPFIGTNVGQIEEICMDQLSKDFLVSDSSPELLSKVILNIYDNPELQNSMKTVVEEKKACMTWIKRAEMLLNDIDC